MKWSDRQCWVWEVLKSGTQLVVFSHLIETDIAAVWREIKTPFAHDDGIQGWFEDKNQENDFGRPRLDNYSPNTYILLLGKALFLYQELCQQTRRHRILCNVQIASIRVGWQILLVEHWGLYSRSSWNYSNNNADQQLRFRRIYGYLVAGKHGLKHPKWRFTETLTISGAIEFVS